MKSVRDEFENLSSIIKLIAEQFGSKCEVVLHDLTGDYAHTIVGIENGQVTGRSIGGCGSNLGLQVLNGKKESNGMFRYYTQLNDGRLVKSSTVYLKDSDGNVIGSICINFDVTDLVNVGKILEEYEFGMPVSSVPEQEVFAESVGELLEELIKGCELVIGKHPSYMSKKEKIEAIKYLDSKGAFLIAKAGDRISKYLQISKNTMYGYLEESRNG